MREIPTAAILTAVLVITGVGCTLFERTIEGLDELCGHAAYTVATDAVGSDPEALCDRASGTCPDLRTALNTANLCQGAGPKVVRLLADATYTVDDDDVSPARLRGRMRNQEARVGGVLLPQILGTVTIEGEGATIERGPSVFPRNRFLHVLEGAHLTLHRLTLRGARNEAGGRRAGDGRGGAAFNEGVLALHDVDVVGDTSTYGGAVYNTGLLTVYGSRFTKNAVTHPIATIVGLGGAIYSTGRVTTDEDTEFSQNKGAGAALYLICPERTEEEESDECNAEAEIRNTAFTGNLGGTGSGTVAVGDRAVARVVGTTFSGNRSPDAAIYLNRGQVTVEQSTFTGNEGSNAASIYVLVGAATIRRSTFSGEAGRAVMCGGSPLNRVVFEDATVFGNAAASGGALRFDGSCSSEFSNTAVAGNSPGNCSFITAPTTRGINLDSDGSCTGFATVADPRLGVLQDNGGTTMTHLPEAGSPLVDAGTTCLPQDQRGRPRPQDGDGDGTPACDVGAVER